MESFHEEPKKDCCHTEVIKDCCHTEVIKDCCHTDVGIDHCHTASAKWRPSKPLWITSLIFLVLLLVSFIPGVEALQQSLFHYIQMMWWAIVLGLLIGGLIDYFVPTGFILKYLGQNKISSLFYGLIAGFFLSVCSHGILAIAMQLHKKGAAVPVIMSFLLAAPWANFVITILLFSFFGWKAFWFIGAAIVVAFLTGLIFMVLNKDKPKVISDQDLQYNWEKLTKLNTKEALSGTLKGSLSLSNMVLWWMLIGIMSAAVIQAYVPQEFFIQYFGPELKGLLLTLGVATVIEVCSEGTAPVAFEIYHQLGVLGNPFVFLMAGVVTDYTEIGMIWTNMGKRPAILLPLIAVPMIVIIGLLFNCFL